MGLSPLEQRLQNIESDLAQIKSLLFELSDVVRVGFQHHSSESIMSAKEVADFLKMDINVIYSKCSKGEIPFFKMGKLYKFKKTEVLEWMKKQESNSPFSVDFYVDRYLQMNTLKG